MSTTSKRRTGPSGPPTRPRPPTAGQSIEVRQSPIHGRGVYATRRIRKGARIIEYTGERISQDEGGRRYDDDGGDFCAHVVLFTLEDDSMIDPANGGNEARYINHSCEPNCEAIEEEGRIFIHAVRTIQPGQELLYDYQLQRPGFEPEDIRDRYPCRCGTPSCRGTMLMLE